METVMWFVNLAWKILCLGLGFMLFRYILAHGSTVFKDILETLGLAARAISGRIRRSIQKEPEAKKEPTRVAVTMTEEEFNQWMAEHPLP